MSVRRRKDGKLFVDFYTSSGRRVREVVETADRASSYGRMAATGSHRPWVRGGNENTAGPGWGKPGEIEMLAGRFA